MRSLRILKALKMYDAVILWYCLEVVPLPFTVLGGNGASTLYVRGKCSVSELHPGPKA